MTISVEFYFLLPDFKATLLKNVYFAGKNTEIFLHNKKYHKTTEVNHTILIYFLKRGISGGVMVNKLDSQTITSEFESHWVPHLYGFVPHLN